MMSNCFRRLGCRSISFVVFCSTIIFSLGTPLFSQQIIVKIKPGNGLGNAPGQNNSRKLPSVIDQFLSEEPSLKAAPFIAVPRTYSESRNFGNIYRLRVSAGSDLDEWVKRFRETPGVEYAEINHRYKVLQTSSDPGVAEQWYLNQIDAPRAWNIERGRAEVVVGIIDTGVDYRHTDLRKNVWVNAAEDLNGNGRLDSLDINGIDDDGNGYVDDVIGWDFTDAPDFPDTGDYLRPDNDPMDEFQNGHGTGIAGIIAAEQDNGIGISGIAPNVRFMILRAGTASGFLEEDDVAEAILYAVDNGSRIINMSFGDPAFSFLLRDAIQYARDRGVLIVAAAGNSGTDRPIYPAAYNATLAVGASNPENERAGFSTFGDFLDLVAPGENIFTTEIGDRYGSLNGTSFSAPMVGAAAALIWSLHPDFSLEQVKGALLAGTKSLKSPAWNAETGHGLLNVFQSLTAGEQGMAAIAFPAADRGISQNQVAVLGTIFSPLLNQFSLFYRLGTESDNWIPVLERGEFQVVDDTLAIWDVSGLADSTYTLKLRMEQEGLKSLTDRVEFRIDRTPPKLTKFESYPVFIGNSPGNLIVFNTDDPSNASLQLTGSALSANKLPFFSPVFSRTHTFLLKENEVSDSAPFEIRLRNDAGLAAIDDNEGNYYRVNFSNLLFSRNVLETAMSFPFTGYFLPQMTDLDRDGQEEIVLSEFNDTVQFGKMQVWERRDTGFSLEWQSDRRAIPRDAADIEGDGKTELLAGFGGTTMLFDSGQPGEWPTRLAWVDSANFWGSRLTNLDADPELEMLAIKNGVWTIFDISPDHDAVTPLQELPNFTDGENQLGIPKIVVADLSGDSLPDIAFGDLDGDVIIYRQADGEFRPAASIRLPGEDATSLLAAGDFTGDGIAELAAVTKVLPPVVTESTVGRRFWQISLLKFTPSDTLELLTEQRIMGVQTGPKLINGLSVIDIDKDGRDEIFFLPFPNLYLFHLENSQLKLWGFETDLMSSAVLLSGSERNGSAALFVNSAAGIREFRAESNSPAPDPPLNLTAVALDTNRIRVDWQPVPGAEYYKIYRRTSADPQFTLLDSSTISDYFDTDVISSFYYTYVVTQINRSFTPIESRFSNPDRAKPNDPPVLASLRIISTRSLELTFSEPMGESVFSPRHYQLLPSGNIPLTDIRSESNRKVILNFDPFIAPADTVLLIRQISDSSGTPLRSDSLRISLRVPVFEPSFYVKKVILRDKKTLFVLFNSPVETSSAVDIQNYLLEPDGAIQKAKVTENDPSRVQLILKGQNRLGSLGVPHFLTVLGVRDRNGTALIAGKGNRIAILEDAPNLDKMVVYPNPLRLNSERNQLMFGNLPRECEILIFSASGRLIRKLRKDNGSGGIIWDLRTSNGNTVSTGVYIFFATSGGEKKKGKFLIIR